MPLTFQLAIFMRAAYLPYNPGVRVEDQRGQARAEVAVIAAGLFVTGLGWPWLIGQVPFYLLLKNRLGLPPQAVGVFRAVTTFAWYVKPLVGLVSDAYPLGGTRRHGYLVAGTAAATALWLAFAFVPVSYWRLLAVMAALNLALAFVSTAVGGLLVEAGQRRGASGRLSALREGLLGLIALVGGPVGGWLAARALLWTASAGALVVGAFLPVVLLLHREPRAAPGGAAAVMAAARRQLAAIVPSRAMWTTAGLLFLVNIAPGFQTPLVYHQQDVLHFSPVLMGRLQAVGGVGAVVGAAAYAIACRFVPVGTSLVAGIGLNAGSTLFYLGYDSAGAAVAITAAAAVLGTLATVPLFDLAVRATPRGSESLGYALMLAVYSLAQFGVSDVLGSWLYGRLHLSFEQLVWVNAASTAAVLLFVPLLPRRLLAAPEGLTAPAQPAR
jgi:hypothetical protein